MVKIRLKYVDAFTDRYGQTRYYFRRSKGPRTPLPGQPGSKAFMDAYADALHGVSSIKPAPGAAGTMHALVTRYYGSSHYLGLSPITRTNYRRVLDSFREACGDRSVAGFGSSHARALLDGVTQERGVHPAYSLWRVLRVLMRFAADDKWRPDNPMAGVQAPRRRKLTGFRPATVDDITRFRDHFPLGTKPRLALELLLSTGARRADAVRIGRQNISGDCLTYTQSKTGQKLSLTMSPELRAAIAAMPATNLTLLVTEYGDPFTPQGFTNWFKAKCEKAGLPANTSPHSLRHALLTQMADGGATAHEIQAVSGHRNIAEVQTYTRSADQKRLASSGLKKVGVRADQEQKNPNPGVRFGKSAKKAK